MGDHKFLFISFIEVLLSVTIWSVIYSIIRRKWCTQSPEYCSRLLALMHGSCMAFLGLNQCFTDASVFDEPEQNTTLQQRCILLISLGYFIVDLVWCLYYQTETGLMIAHHTYSCIALARMISKGTGGHVAACGLGALEVTNPLLQARWFARTHGYLDSPLFKSLEATFIISFFFIRIVLGSVYVVIVLLKPQNSWELRITFFIIYTLSWMFMMNIVNYFKHKYLGTNAEVELAHINSS